MQPVRKAERVPPTPLYYCYNKGEGRNARPEGGAHLKMRRSRGDRRSGEAHLCSGGEAHSGSMAM